MDTKTAQTIIELRKLHKSTKDIALLIEHDSETEAARDVAFFGMHGEHELLTYQTYVDYNLNYVDSEYKV